MEEKSSMPIPGEEYHVTPEGSLGLLALGAAGLKAWRKSRLEAGKNEKKGSKDES